MAESASKGGSAVARSQVDALFRHKCARISIAPAWTV
jgi:hypothetical protein